tara:strand:+ start:146909 stop:147430 length:522 start_codon:yes stop_codon:yes gene_type:complete
MRDNLKNQETYEPPFADVPQSNWRVEGEGGGGTAGGGLSAGTVAKIILAVGGAASAIVLSILKSIKDAKEDAFWNHPYKWCADDMSGKGKDYGLAVLVKVQAKFQTKPSEVTKGDDFVKTWSKADKKALGKTLSSLDSVEKMTAYMETYELNGTKVPFIPGSSLVALVGSIFG